GPDPDDEATNGTERKAPGAFVAGLDREALKGARLGLLRQRFVGVTQEREAAERMEGVARDLRAAGATVVDVVIPDYDTLYKQNVLRNPAALVAAWDAYLSRGQRPGEKSLTVADLLASGLLAPESTATFQNAVDALATAPAD